MLDHRPTFTSAQLYCGPAQSNPVTTYAAIAPGLCYTTHDDSALGEEEEEQLQPPPQDQTSGGDDDVVVGDSETASVPEPTVTNSLKAVIREDAPEFVPRDISAAVFTPQSAASTSTLSTAATGPTSRRDPPQLVPLPNSRNWSAPSNWADAPEFVPKGKWTRQNQTIAVDST